MQWSSLDIKITRLIVRTISSTKTRFWRFEKLSTRPTKQQYFIETVSGKQAILMQ